MGLWSVLRCEVVDVGHGDGAGAGAGGGDGDGGDDGMCLQDRRQTGRKMPWRYDRCGVGHAAMWWIRGCDALSACWLRFRAAHPCCQASVGEEWSNNIITSGSSDLMSSQTIALLLSSLLCDESTSHAWVSSSGGREGVGWCQRECLNGDDIDFGKVTCSLNPCPR